MAAAVASAIPQPPVAAGTPASNDDSYGEEECTMDFGDEEINVVPMSTTKLGSAVTIPPSYATLQHRHLLACQHPGGEDFGVYLKEDLDDSNDASFLPDAASAIDSSGRSNVADPLSANLSGSDQPTATRRFRKRYETPSVVTSPEGAERQSSASPPPLPPANDWYASRPHSSTSSTSSDDHWSKIEFQQDPIERGRSPVMPPSFSSPQLNNLSQTSGGSTANVGSTGTIDRQRSLSTVRDKFTRFLKLSSSSSSASTMKKAPTADSRPRSSSIAREAGTLHNFSFADSKMASEFLHKGNDSAQLETRSDFGGGYPSSSSSGRPGSTWWDVGTLSSARSVQMSESSGSGRNKDQPTDKVRLPIPKFFRRNRRSKSVPDVNYVPSHDTSSALSNGSGSGRSSSGGFGEKQTKSPTRLTLAATNGAPPALPPMRKPTPRNTETASALSLPASDGGNKTGSRLKGMWKRLTDSGSGTAQSQTKGRPPSYSGEVPTLPRVEQVSTLRFSRTVDEESIKL